MIALAAFTARGCELGKKLEKALGGRLYTTERLAKELGLPCYGDLRRWTEIQFQNAQALVFIGASGIAVRSVAPFVADKFTDPAVVSVDEMGRFAVPLLSGHVGGANALAKRIAELTQGQAAISTATDVNGKFAVDVWAAGQNLVICQRERAKLVSAAILEGKQVGIRSDYPIAGSLPQGLELNGSRLGISIGAAMKDAPFETTLHLVPRAITLGVGCRRGTSLETLETALGMFLEETAIPLEAITGIASIDLKKDEPGLLKLAETHGWETRFYTSQVLAGVEGDFPSSSFVKQTTGVDNVCQRAAQCVGGTIIVPKTICHGVTFAAAMDSVKLRWEE